MKKVAIIYWSYSGNVEVIANHIAQGAQNAGAEVIIKYVQDARTEDVISADAVALGSPSLDDNSIEQDYMAPFVKEFKTLPVNGKSLVLFGSYGWDDGVFLKEWKETMTDYGFNLVGELAVKESPNAEELEKAKNLGELLAK
ncbi:flavodoxin [Clostridium sp. DJ247]|uniref:flavodoxin n=1 Tax=Clostridium sp. DJ247 TaxID=2726188 RepID=UPI001629C9F4|nr:flavodoxin [Clostridium sp. DJ247]MBC2582250.1 flavodoxin [Clostridium sp. DJ247]